MSERTSYAPGTPCWVDLARPTWMRRSSSTARLFGWEVPELPKTSSRPAATAGRRRTAADVAGMMPLMQEGQPPAWTTYVSVDDADATAAAVKETAAR